MVLFRGLWLLFRGFGWLLVVAVLIAFHMVIGALFFGGLALVVGTTIAQRRLKRRTESPTS